MSFHDLARIRFNEWLIKRGHVSTKVGNFVYGKNTREKKDPEPKLGHVGGTSKKVDNAATNALWQTTGELKPDSEKKKNKKERRERWYSSKGKLKERTEEDRLKARKREIKYVEGFSEQRKEAYLARRRANNKAWKLRKAEKSVKVDISI